MDYTQDAALALSMIREAGTVVTVRRVTDGTSYDPVADVVTGSTVSTFTVDAVLLPLSPRDQFVISGTGITSDNAKILMPTTTTAGAALPYAPRPGDNVIFGALGSPNANWWKVDAVQALRPALVTVVYSLIVTRGSDILDKAFSG